MNKTLTILTLVVLLLASCGRKTQSVPTDSTPLEQEARIYPDYKDVVIPPNIAPLNFMLQDSLAQGIVAQFKGEKGELIVAGGKDLKVEIDTTEWRTLLQNNKAQTIHVTIFAQYGNKWVSYLPYTLQVAQEDIDPYLSYRLIEPGYELYRQLGLYQRNLTNFNQETIYENNRSYDEEHNHCVNCHNYQNYSTENMLFHVRAQHSGTIIVNNGKARKVQIKGDSILSAGVYPSWHPTLPLIAFSTNITGQSFHMKSREKIEVLDERSDLLLYDVQKDHIQLILNEKQVLETFPAWSPDGKYLYYCVAKEPAPHVSVPDSMLGMKMMRYHDSIYYDIRRLPFDAQKRSFGESEMVVECANRHRSAAFPRISPDGRYLLWAEADYGQFHIWHHTADLFAKDLQTDSIYALEEANSPDVDSYHTWSSNGRWIVFSSRRMDGNYTRPFIAYFDAKGHAHKAFCLPQRDPEHNILLLKSYNVPELTKDAVRTTPAELKKVIYN